MGYSIDIGRSALGPVPSLEPLSGTAPPVAPGQTTSEQASADVVADVLAGPHDGVSSSYNPGTRTVSLANTDKGSDAVSGHEAAVDPHPQYLTETEADALYEPIGGGGGVSRLDIAASAMSPNASGGCAPLAVVNIAADQPDLVTLNFDPTSVEGAQAFFTLPDGWGASQLQAEVIWSHPATTVNFDVVWGVRATSAENDGSMAVAFGGEALVADSGGTTNDLYFSPLSLPFTPSGPITVGAGIFLQVRRKAADSGDTLAVDARLHGVRLYRVDPGGDIYFANVVLLMECEGANGGNVFTDDSNSAHPVSRVGSSVVTSTAQFKYGTSSIRLPGATEYLTIPNSPDFNFGAGDFTVECWFRPDNVSALRFMLGTRPAAGGDRGWVLSHNGSGLLAFTAWNSAGSAFVSTAAGAMSAATWHHCAVTRQGNTFRLFLDGVVTATVVTSTAIGDSSHALQSRDPTTAGRNGLGYIDGIRITKGIARYTSAFTPPTGPYPT